ncbi:MAG: PEP-CTERM sorting domain-containing protein [Methyloprofundus sp.]|nr:PEP-CTERM sorting domain-containing protein [Methyloprofundus sp.]
MIKNKLSITTLTIALLSISHVNAEIIDNDSYTTDTISGLDWLDLSATRGMSYDQVVADTELNGWRFATTSEVSSFFDAFGGDSNFYNGYSTQNNGLFDVIAPLWGDLRQQTHLQIPNEGDGFSKFFTQASDPTDFIPHGLIYDEILEPETTTQDYVSISFGSTNSVYSDLDTGSALVRNTVPEPTTFILISTGLLGMLRLRQRAYS